MLISGKTYILNQRRFYSYWIASMYANYHGYRITGGWLIHATEIHLTVKPLTVSQNINPENSARNPAAL